MSYKDNFIGNIENAISQYENYNPQPETYDQDMLSQEQIAMLEDRFNSSYNPKSWLVEFKYLTEEDIKLWDWTLLFEDWLTNKLN